MWHAGCDRGQMLQVAPLCWLPALYRQLGGYGDTRLTGYGELASLYNLSWLCGTWGTGTKTWENEVGGAKSLQSSNHSLPLHHDIMRHGDTRLTGWAWGHKAHRVGMGTQG